MKISPYIYPGLQLAQKQTMQTIAEKICRNMGIGLDAVKSKSHARCLTECRHLCMYFVVKHTSMTLEQIGLFFGGRHHSTVIYARSIVEDLRDTDRAFYRKFMEIDRLIKNG